MSNYSLSISIPETPSLTPASIAPPAPVTNSLVIANIPSPFFHPVVLDALRDHFSSYGKLYAWAPLKSFRRVLLVYYSECDAENAKLCCDGFTIEASPDSPETQLRVYRADPTPIPSSSADSSGTSSPTHPLDKKYSPYHLRPPAVEKNFLISPPGSPPVGWESMREERPNDAPLADDLITALRQLQFSQERKQDTSSPCVSVLVDPDEGPGVGIYVEDCDEKSPSSGQSDDSDSWNSRSYQEERWFYASDTRSHFVPAPTSRPPMPAFA